MSDVEVFQFPATGQQIRMVLRGDEPWFIGRDACSVLALAKPENSLALLDEDEKDTHTVGTPGGPQVVTLINESGLYSLILRSRKKEAKVFKRWITHEVLPAIRKTGSYGLTPATPALPDMRTPEGRLAVAEMLADGARREMAIGIERDQAKAVATERGRQLAIAGPKADYVDAFVSATNDLTTIRTFAGQLGMSEPVLRSYLVGRKVIYRRLVGHRWSNSKKKRLPEYQWLAYAKYATWFTARDQPEAPPLHNGQLPTTLYVTPVGKTAIRALLVRHPIDVSESEDGDE